MSQLVIHSEKSIASYSYKEPFMVQTLLFSAPERLFCADSMEELYKLRIMQKKAEAIEKV